MKTFKIETSPQTAPYDYLSRLSSDRWAWEFIRRNPEFRRDATQHAHEQIKVDKAHCADIRILRSPPSQVLADRWGLVFLPDPALNGLEADAVWSHYVFPDQVEVNCTPRKPGQRCDIWDRTVPHCAITHITDRVGREYLLLRGNDCVVQVRCTGMSLLSLEPVRMKLQISDMEAYERKLKLQKEAFRLYGKGPNTSTPRWTKTSQILRNGIIALDCLDAGMNQREIAVLLYGADTVAGEWGVAGSCLRASVRYLTSKALGLRDGGYLVELLGARHGRRPQAA